MKAGPSLKTLGEGYDMEPLRGGGQPFRGGSSKESIKVKDERFTYLRGDYKGGSIGEKRG